MVDRTHGSTKVNPTEAATLADDSCPSKVSTDQELSFFEGALVLANPTPEDDEAFREYLRKNGSNGGDP